MVESRGKKVPGKRRRENASPRDDAARASAPPAAEGPVSLGRLLGDVARARGDHVDVATWRRVVGDRVAHRTAPERFRDGRLTVRVTSPTWAQELSFLSETIRQRLADEGVEVSEIRFRVGDVEPPPPRGPSLPPAVDPAPLPRDLTHRLARIDDPELRNAIAEAAGISIARGSQRR